MFDFLFVPTILFIVIVMPIWIIMHYRSKGASQNGLQDNEREQLDDLLASIDQLTDRIGTLEQILDDDHGGWRQQHANTNEEPPHDV